MVPPQLSPLKKVRKGRSVRTPGMYKGVRMRAWGKWVSEIRVPKTGRRLWLGSYDSPEKAARAYDAAQYCIHGEGGQFNFPAERRPELPKGPVSLFEKDIKAIAFNFASSEVSEAFRSLSTETNPLVSDEPASLNLLVSSGAKDAADAEVHVPPLSAEAASGSAEDFRLDDFLMLDIEWIDSL